MEAFIELDFVSVVHGVEIYIKVVFDLAARKLKNMKSQGYELIQSAVQPTLVLNTVPTETYKQQ